MNQIKCSILNYYRSSSSNEHMPLGVLVAFSDGECCFNYEHSDFKGLQEFDNEIDIEFIRAYLEDIKNEIKFLASIDSLIPEQYIKTYVNNFRFSDFITLNI